MIDAESLLANFETLADAPGGVGRLRELILQLAVQGRLVLQDPNEEPAEVLLARIAKEKQCLVETGGTGKAKRPDPLKTSIGLPSSWRWANIGEFAMVTMGQSPPSSSYNEKGDGLPFLQGKKDFGPVSPTPTTWCSAPSKIATAGDVLISVRAPVGPTNLADCKCCIGRGLAALRPTCGSSPMYLLYAVRAHETGIAAMGVGSTFVAISRSHLDTFPLPIPPLAEQWRIVAKVDELMALCDELEARQEQRHTVRRSLQTSVLEALSSADNPDALAEAWNRVRTNWDALTARPDSIRPLRQAILELAVQGKLVPQNPDDEPAERALSKAGVELGVIEAAPSPLPNGWAWTTIGRLGEFRGGGTPSKSNAAYWSGDIPWVSPKDMKRLLIGEAQNSITELALTETTVKLIPVGSILMVVRGMILAHSFPVARTTATVTLNQDMKALLLAEPRFGEYVLLQLRGYRTRMLQQVERSTHGTCRLPTERILNFTVAIPPVAEQRRIVAKVDELMALCGELESRLQAEQDTSGRFASASSRSITA